MTGHGIFVVFCQSKCPINSLDGPLFLCMNRLHNRATKYCQSVSVAFTRSTMTKPIGLNVKGRQVFSYKEPHQQQMHVIPASFREHMGAGRVGLSSAISCLLVYVLFLSSGHGLEALEFFQANNPSPCLTW